MTASDHVALVDGDIGDLATAARIVEAALSRYQSIDVLVNNAGIFFTERFTDYTSDDFQSLVSTNLGGFLYDAVLYLTDATTKTGQIFYVDGGAHFGHW